MPALFVTAINDHTEYLFSKMIELAKIPLFRTPSKRI